jgi:hypothetical protein
LTGFAEGVRIQSSAGHSVPFVRSCSITKSSTAMKEVSSVNEQTNLQATSWLMSFIARTLVAVSWPSADFISDRKKGR